MHLIPQSSSHWHILVSVFPSIGLVFVLGFYIAGFRAGNAFAQQVSLALLGAIALLSLPIYVSGVASMAALSENTRFAQATMDTHYLWGLITLGGLVLAGAVAVAELWRSRSATGASSGPFYVVLALSTVVLALTLVASEIGLELSHRELELPVTIPDISTPQAWSHAHIILNHIPTAGFVFALAFFVFALFTNNEGMKRGSLVAFIICSIAGVPAYVAGTAAMWALTQPPIPDLPVSLAVINSHRDMALWTLFGLAFTGAAAWIELWRARSRGALSTQSLYLILLFAVVTLAIMTETGHRGGLINHPEIVTASDTLPTDPMTGISVSLETRMTEMIWFTPWQIVHFFGFSLIFGAVVAVVARVLGFFKSVPFAAMHQVLVLGFVGVMLNVVSGMLMMFADSYRYVVSDVGFAPKIAFIAIGATAVLYFSLSGRLWNVKPGEDAPAAAKWVAALVLLAWTGVIVFGRMLPYL